MSDLKFGISHAIRVKVYPRGLRRLCVVPGFKDRLQGWLNQMEERLWSLCQQDGGGESGGDAPLHYMCQDEPVPGQPDCVQEVCYDDNGLEVSRGPIRCPPGAGPEEG